MKRLIVLLGVAFLLALAGAANAGLMAVWDFGPESTFFTLVPQFEYVSGVPTLTAGGADYDDNGGNGVAFLDAANNSHIEGQALHWNDVSGEIDDAYIIITIDTTGWHDMSIRWDYKSKDATKKGPVSFDLDYAVGTGDWTNLLNNYPITRNGAWHEFSYDLSSLTAINNQPSVQFRINDLNEDDLNSDYWQDNIQFTGVPEPLTVVFLALGGVALLRKRPKQK
jgi:hypothetical protein